MPFPFSTVFDSLGRVQSRTRPRETYPKPSQDITVETFDQATPNPRSKPPRGSKPRSRPRHGWITPRVGFASRPPPLRYTPLRDLRSVPLRVDGLLAKHGSRPRHEGAEGGAPPTAVPPTKTRPNILLTGTPKQGSKAAIRDTPRREQGTPCEAQLRPPPNGLRARRSPPPHR